MENLLEIRGLKKKFLLHILNDKKIDALEDISFTMAKGEIIGLTGKSGSGKSSLMKCLYGTYLINEGEILYHSGFYGEIDLAKASEHEILAIRRNEMTYCSQFLQVIPRVPAVEIVAEQLIKENVDRDEALEKARSFLEELGLPQELWDAYPSTFSGGEQQRINVAQAIISTPRFLLIDEPTASLDQKTKDVVIGKILDLKRRGTSIILITHDEYTLSNLADRELKLKSGRIEEVEVATA
ncbi:phosphonate C-P lyase system protein PhnL [Candidatus Pelagisphaera phototrophica]|uniref:phosphonate C-P lyase system protein PhnL n=1 Tax=Candidatus Pelagisphaera phototrophica TaxID=2684113 RepID=UPI001A01F4B8|nr:ATP-binding cassette domain-containing protein [Candidatus Pelagisphaera phototrophica]QXD31715.1 ATP-binding cassette domain-containing protein [Candidatus Pelagisphaera phototrophica]